MAEREPQSLMLSENCERISTHAHCVTTQMTAIQTALSTRDGFLAQTTSEVNSHWKEAKIQILKLYALVSGMDRQVCEYVDDVDRLLCIDRTSSIESTNAASRLANSQCRNPEDALTPLVSVTTGYMLRYFPRTLGDTEYMTYTKHFIFLGALGEDCPEDSLERHRKFKRVIGVQV